MSSLNFNEKRALEELFEMNTGYVLDLSDRSLAEFFSDFKVDIEAEKYKENGASKARRLRSFWRIEDDLLVGKVLLGLIDLAKTRGAPHSDLTERCLRAAHRLLGTVPTADPDPETESQFLSLNLKVDLNRLPIENALLGVIEQRFKEIQICLKNGASLSVIFLCGSTLEGLLLNQASRNPEAFNKANCAPRGTAGKVRPFNEWTLHDLLSAAAECSFIKRDVLEFGRSLRRFRNYIHPHQQAQEEFTPDSHTAAICCQVLNAAIADLSGVRP